jgi:dTDP-4-amino-4,6-dideoxygalactose transaminase
MLIFGAPRIEQDEIDEVIDCLRSGWLGTGPKVHNFELNFASYKQARYAMAVNSGTAALHLSMLAANLNIDDEVITTPLTFCATINAICHAGAKPVLVDVDPRTMNIDPEKIEDGITSRTRAILPVHLGGRPCEMDRICEIAKEYNLKIIEDCAHAIETEYKGRKAGTFGDFGCFSFYVTKNVITGEGGMIITENEENAHRIKMLALHGLDCDAWKRFSDSGYKHYYVREAGFKYNMMDIQAAIGIHQLKRVETNWQRRRMIWSTYQDAFKDLPIETPAECLPGTRHAYHLYTILIDKEKTGISRDKFLEEITKLNIGVGVHYLSIPEHPYYTERFGWAADHFPNARDIGRKTVSLPLSPKLSDRDVEDVIVGVRKLIHPN